MNNQTPVQGLGMYRTSCRNCDRVNIGFDDIEFTEDVFFRLVCTCSRVQANRTVLTIQ